MPNEMWKLNDRAFDAALIAYHRTYLDQYGPLKGAITAYLAAYTSDAERHERGVADDFVAGYDAGLKSGEADVSATTRQAIAKAHTVLKIYQRGMLVPSIDIDDAVRAIELAGLDVSPPAAVQEPVAVKGETPSPQTSLSGWQPMETAPKDGKHSILAIPAGGGFIYSIQGSFMRGKWMNAADINAEPLAWMPNILLPDEFCPWTDEFKSRAALSATATEVALSTSQSDPAPEIISGTESPADQIIGEIEALFPNWRSYRDLIDCIECTLHTLRKDARHEAQ